MAKGSAMGLWKGKKGSSVFYQIKNSNSLQKQGVRERNYEPANPRSARQADQRMKMYPAQAVYGAIKDVIERSWQGVKYGQMTRQAYLKGALREPLFPSIAKGDGSIVPGPYQISKGTLQEMEAYLSNGAFQFQFALADQHNFESTLGEVSTDLLANNTWLKSGDQLSFVLCHTNVDGIGFFWTVISFFLNESSDILMADVLAALPTAAEEISIRQDGITFKSDNHIFMAAACVISREGTTPLRSNARLVCDYRAGGMPSYYSDAAFAAARRSYMNPVPTSVTDWPADPEEEETDPNTVTITVEQVTVDGQGQEVQTPGGRVSGGGEYALGERVTIREDEDGNHNFSGWYPTKEDAIAGTNLLSSGGILLFIAGDSSAFGGITTFWGKFVPRT